MHKDFEKFVLEEFENRFWVRVKVGSESDCWEWTGHRHPKGYGAFKGPNGKLMKAHRIAYQMTKGNIPDGLLCMHSCDNPPCCNPAHLSVGTDSENMTQMHERGRANRAVGSKHHNARLMEADVAAIKRRLAVGESQIAIANDYGLHRQTVHQIKSGRLWKHVQ